MNHADLTTQFIAKWGPGGAAFSLNEEQGAQQHFIELCAVLGVPAPEGGDDYLFEKGALLLGQRRGYADVFKRGCFAWENKAPGKPLDAALRQLMTYALALDNPPLLIVSDRLRIEVHTHFNGTPSERYVVTLADLSDPAKRELLRRCFSAPESFKPARTNRQITEEAANAFATTAERLRAAGIAPEVVSHLLTQCLFCFFAEDVGLLPGRLFERLVGNRDAEPAALRRGLHALFSTMRDGGLFGADSIAWFNGGLFAKVDVPPLTPMDVAALRNAAALDWSAIDPSILGTLFVRGLDPKKRAQLGAHFTDPATIMRLVEPVVQRPLKAEWEQVKLAIAAHMGKHRKAGDAEYRKANAAFVGFLEKLRAFRVLDPACGSGNFLYLVLKALKDIEHQANIEAESLGLQRQVDAYTSPANVLGIELDEYAAELARVTVWIGELQWRLQHGYPFKLNPVLDPLDQIECRDALMNADGSEAVWPVVSVVVGNPPFVGNKRVRSELGDRYTKTLRGLYAGRVPGEADLVCYWFAKGLAAIEKQGLGAVGLVATNSIRQGANRDVLDVICRSTRIFEAWSDMPWINEGAAVRVSLVCFGLSDQEPTLDGAAVARIPADLSAHGSDLTVATALQENARSSFQGTSKVGPFEIPGATARAWLRLPNVNGRPSSDVVKLWTNGQDVVKRPSDTWIVDFGTSMSEADANGYEAPFLHATQHVKAERQSNNREAYRKYWWRHAEARTGLRAALAPLDRFMATPRVAKHRLFAWLDRSVLPDTAVVCIARSDDATFGVVQSRVHELWTLQMCSWLGVGNDPRYTPKSTFETFPFPVDLTPADTAHQRTESLPDGALIPADLPPAIRPHAEAIAHAAKRLNDLRERWLNPPEWTRREPEVVPLGFQRSADGLWYLPAPASTAGFQPEAEAARDALRSPQAGPLFRALRAYPDRILPRDGFEKQLAQRTLTKLYNERPAWLAQAHEALDAAVATAYGWADYSPQTPDEEILRRLLALNRERSG